MSAPDIINGCIYLALTCFVWVSIRRVLIDREVKGVSWMTLGGFFSRSLWNLYFYTFLSQWFSLVGVFLLGVSELIYVILLYRYSQHFRREIHKTVIQPVKDVIENLKND
jgi:hypothetical protein